MGKLRGKIKNDRNEQKIMAAKEWLRLPSWREEMTVERQVIRIHSGRFLRSKNVSHFLEDNLCALAVPMTVVSKELGLDFRNYMVVQAVSPVPDVLQGREYDVQALHGMIFVAMHCTDCNVGLRAFMLGFQASTHWPGEFFKAKAPDISSCSPAPFTIEPNTAAPHVL